MDGFDLVRAGTCEPVAAACGKCGKVHLPMIYVATPDRAMAAARQAADECCVPRKCEDCGGDTERSWLVCGDCREKRERAKSRERFEAATVVPWDNEAGAVLYDEEHDRWIIDVEDAEDADPPTRYAYATNPRPLTINGEDLIERELEEHYDDAADQISAPERAELQEFLDGWCQRTGIVSYFPDYSRVVVFSLAPTTEAPDGDD